MVHFQTLAPVFYVPVKKTISGGLVPPPLGKAEEVVVSLDKTIQKRIAAKNRLACGKRRKSDPSSTQIIT
jgi:hypothetical protein